MASTPMFPVAPQVRPVLSYVSPNKEDTAFYILVDSRIPANQQFEYGEAPRGTLGNAYPNHFLCYVRPDADTPHMQRWYYLAERESQNDYNFAFGDLTVAGRAFRSVTRTYIVRRSEYDDDAVAIHAPIDNVPQDIFYTNGAADYRLFDRQTQRVDDKELDSMFIVETRIYVDKVAYDAEISAAVGVDTGIPAEFRRGQPSIKRTFIREGQFGNTAAVPLPQGADSRAYDQIRDGFYTETLTYDAGLNFGGNVSLTGGLIAYVDGGGIGAVTKTLASSQLTVDQALDVIESNVSALGGGAYLRTTVRAQTFPVLSDFEWNYDLNTHAQTTRQHVAPVDPAATNPQQRPAAGASYKSVNKDRMLKVVEVEPTAALTNYVLQYPTVVDVELPDVLHGIQVDFVKSSGQGDATTDWVGYAQGDAISLSGTDATTAECSGSVTPRITLDIEEVWSKNRPAQVCYFFAKGVSNSLTATELLAALNARLGLVSPTSQVQAWPTFRPRATVIHLEGGSARVRASVSMSGAYSRDNSPFRLSRDLTVGRSSDVIIDPKVDTMNLRPMLHADLSRAPDQPNAGDNPDLKDSLEVTASAAASLAASDPIPQLNEDGTPVLGEDGQPVTTEQGIVATPFQPTTHEIHASVRISSPASSPTDVPREGKFLLQSVVEPYKWGWFRVKAVVVDMTE